VRSIAGFARPEQSPTEGLEKRARVPAVLGARALVGGIEGPEPAVGLKSGPSQSSIRPNTRSQILRLPVSRSRSRRCSFLSRLNTQKGRSISTPEGLRTFPSKSSDKASPVVSWLISELQPAHIGLKQRLSWPYQICPWSALCSHRIRAGLPFSTTTSPYLLAVRIVSVNEAGVVAAQEALDITAMTCRWGRGA